MKAVSRLPALTALVVSSVLLLSGTAFAHITVQPEGVAAKGGYATVNFVVANENRDNSSMVKLEVTFPVKHPLSCVMPQPVPGWKAWVTETKLPKPLTLYGKQLTEAASKITWTADGGKLAPGEFQQFPVSLGRLPDDADKLVFKAVQTFDNLATESWFEESGKSLAEPARSAPVLVLSAQPGDRHSKSEDAASHAEAADTLARVLAIVGFLVGVAGVAVGALTGCRPSA